MTSVTNVAASRVEGAPVAVLWVIYVAVAVLAIVGLWMVFQKAGEAGWKALIPIWNLLVLLRIVGRPAWWIVLLLIPIVNVIFSIVVLYDLSKSFGHDVGYTIGLVLLPFVFIIILGFGPDPYLGPGGKRGPQAPAA